MLHWKELIEKEMDLEKQLYGIKRYMEDDLYDCGPFMKRTDMPVEAIDKEIKWITKSIEELRINPADNVSTARAIRKLEELRKDFNLAKEISLKYETQ